MCFSRLYAWCVRGWCGVSRGVIVPPGKDEIGDEKEARPVPVSREVLAAVEVLWPGTLEGAREVGGGESSPPTPAILAREAQGSLSPPS